MSSKSETARKDNCTSGLLAYDGGVIQLDKSDLWILCDDDTCRHNSCRGVLAADEQLTGEGSSARAVRVRSLKELQSHSDDKGKSFRCIISAKNEFYGSRPAPSLFSKSGQRRKKDFSRGVISLEQASSVTSFPVGGRAKTWRKNMVASLVEKHSFEKAEVFARRKEILMSRMRDLTEKNGIDAVRQAVYESEAAGQSLALTLQFANERLASRRTKLQVGGETNHTPDRFSKKPLTQAVKATQRAKPSRELFALAPKSGEVVGDRLFVEIESPHFAYRFLDRGLDGVSEENLSTLKAPNPDLVAKLQKTINSVVSEAVFTHSVDASRQNDSSYLPPSVLDEARRAATSKFQAQKATSCEVRMPHPIFPDQDLIVILDLHRQAKINGTTRWVARPKTCIRVARTSDGDERKSFGDSFVSEAEQQEIEAAFQRSIRQD